ncbi:hypothetical protein WS83_27895 [Burkholderia sp. MSMB2042]|nr:hypothetical protein WS78_32240 [Burkholderia savannae]KVG38946.1 hypothetical protein WS77_20575 [Burkholderia sp. MSMB0265]KVG81671.1 hypothetical protein WS81_02320 [Burkholderia sp. MSMB2040]KVG98830.1 hypothetical protein WS83_27895 [Burkholderia sp. MSMB2042]KVG99009.1 hypothetical protein WS82_25770 [Burkholderia sp. MSMB2041]KVK76082.1 hypothetical protein WS91_16835 [Burkholderia sp. MSMB1498]
MYYRRIQRNLRLVPFSITQFLAVDGIANKFDQLHDLTIDRRANRINNGVSNESRIDQFGVLSRQQIQPFNRLPIIVDKRCATAPQQRSVDQRIRKKSPDILDNI